VRRYQPRHGARTRAIGVVGKRCVVGRADLVAHRPATAALHEPADVDRRRGLDRLPELPPDFRHRNVAGGQARVGDDQVGEPFGMLGGQPQPDQAAPVLSDQSHPLQVQLVEHQLAHPLDVARIAVILDAGRLVRAPEADQVRANDAVPGCGQHRDHLSVQERPRRLAMQQQDRVGVGRAVLHPGHPQRVAFVVGNVGIMCGIREFRQSGEPVVRCAQPQHECEHTPSGSALPQTAQARVGHQLIEQGALTFQQLVPGAGHRKPFDPVDFGKGSQLP
jgi:hypothetical protein